MSCQIIYAALNTEYCLLLCLMYLKCCGLFSDAFSVFMKVRGKKNGKEGVKKEKEKKYSKLQEKSGKKRNKEFFFGGGGWGGIKVGIEQWKDLDEKIYWNVKTN